MGTACRPLVVTALMAAVSWPIVAPPIPRPATAQVATRIGPGSLPALSADGRVVTYSAYTASPPDVVAGPCRTGFLPHVFVLDRLTGVTTCASVASDGTPGNGSSAWSRLSADGRIVVFQSDAANLVPGDTNERNDIFVHDRAAGTTTRVSVASDGTQANADSVRPAVSGDGRLVVFASFATNLTPDSVPGGTGIFVHDRATGLTTRVGTGPSYYTRPAISEDGRMVAFEWGGEVLLHDRTTGTTSGFIPPLAQVFGSSGLPALSADGLVVAFSSGSSMLVPDDTNWVGDVFVYDQARATTTRVSVASSGVEGNRDSGLDGPSLTADGRFVAFSSHATNLVPGDANGWNDVFVHDRARRLTTRVAPPAELEAAGVYQGSRRPAMSADGRVIAFEAQARNPAPRGEGPTYFTYVYVAELPFGEDVPVPARYWGPPAAALAAFRPSTGAWWLDRPGDQGPAAIPWGAAALGDVPVPADYDGDGHADIAVFRRFSGEWFILPSSGAGQVHLAWGAGALGDQPVPADYDSDGRADIAVFRPSTGQWFILRSSDLGLTHLAWGAGALGDQPVPADYDGDGRADIAVFRPSSAQWFILRSSDLGLTHLAWGAAAFGDVPVPADYDGDGRADVAVFRRLTADWFILGAGGAVTVATFP